MHNLYRDDYFSQGVSLLGFSELLILIARSLGIEDMAYPMRFLLSVSIFMFFIMTGYELKPCHHPAGYLKELRHDTLSILLPFILVSLFIQSGLIFTSKKIYLLWIILGFYIIRAAYAIINSILLYFHIRQRTYITWMIMLIIGLAGSIPYYSSGSQTILSPDCIFVLFFPALIGLFLRHFHERYIVTAAFKILIFIITAALFVTNIITGLSADAPFSVLNIFLLIASALFLLGASRYALRIPVLKDIATTIAAHPVLIFCIARMDTYIRRTWDSSYAVTTAFLRIVADLALTLIISLTVDRFHTSRTNRADFILCQKYQKTFSVYFYIVFAVMICRATLAQTMIPDSYPGNIFNTWISILAVCMAGTLILIFAISLVSIRRNLQFIFELILFIAAQVWYHEASVAFIFNLLMLTLAATGKDFRKIMKIYFAEVLAILIIAWWVSLHGYVTNLIFFRDKVNKLFPRYALGTNYVTDLAAHWFYLISIACVIKPKKRNWTSFIIYPVLIYIAYYIYHLTNARLNMIASFAVIFITLAAHIRSCFPAGKTYQRIADIIGYIFSFSYLFCMALSFYMVANYNMETSEMPFQSLLDKILELSNLQQRLRISKTALSEYPLTVFGNASRYTEIGEGGTFTQSQTITFLDISYIKIPFMYGILIAAILLSVWTWTAFYHARQHHLFLVLILTVIAFTGLIEHHLAEYYYNLFSLGAFATGLASAKWPDQKRTSK